MLLFGFIHGHAQTVTLSQLAGTKWIDTDLAATGIHIIREFSRTQITYTAYIESLDKTIVNTFDFYLSDKELSTFDKSKVGKAAKGDYIVIYNDKREVTECLRVMSFSKDKLTIFYKQQPGRIGSVNRTAVYDMVK